MGAVRFDDDERAVFPLFNTHIGCYEFDGCVSVTHGSSVAARLQAQLPVHQCKQCKSYERYHIETPVAAQHPQSDLKLLMPIAGQTQHPITTHAAACITACIDVSV